MAAIRQLPDPTELLSASHLAHMEEAYAEVTAERLEINPPPLLSLQDATDALRRIRWHRQQNEADKEQVERLLAPLYEQIDQAEAWLAERVTQRQKAIEYHERRLTEYYRLNPPSKGQTLKLPGGAVKMRKPAAKYDYGDETTLLAWLKANAPEAVRVKEEIAKSDLRRMVVVGEGGRAVLADTGEIVPEVQIIEQEPVYSVEVE